MPLAPRAGGFHPWTTFAQTADNDAPPAASYERSHWSPPRWTPVNSSR